MRIKSLLAAAGALSLAVAPVAAQAQAAASAAITPATEEVEGSEIRGGFILPLIAIIAIILAILHFTGDDDPIST